MPRGVFRHSPILAPMNSIVISGGCQCGAVSYVVHCAPSVVLNCHCSDCRKAAGAPFVTWAIFPRAALRWTGSAPKRYVQGERHRLFCPDCGTPVVCMPGEKADIIVVPVCTTSHPERIAPVCHAWAQDQLPWIHLADALPVYDGGIAASPPEALQETG